MKHPNASTAIAKQKAMGKSVIECFPLYPPVEIFSAMGFLPVVFMIFPFLRPGSDRQPNYTRRCESCAVKRKLLPPKGH